MLLGDDTSQASSSTTTTNRKASVVASQSQAQGHEQSQDPEEAKFGTTLDVLHASSAALIDGMRDILLESDFENAMKVLTSWIPIQDEDLFMRIARAEWKTHLKKHHLKS